MRSDRVSKALACALAVAALTLGAGAGTGAAEAREVPRSFAPVAKDVMPAVVNISTRKTVEGEGGSPLGQLPPGHPLRKFFEGLPGTGDGPERQLRSLGSGFVIDGDGYVVTNHHVIREADEVTVILHDDSRLQAKVVGSDPKTDLALLKVETDRKLPEVDWGDSTKAQIGDWVLAIGNPFGLGGSVTAGIVSARGRDINAGPYSRFIQTDTAINKGNSGGPLFNLDGKVVGVNTAILSPSGGNVGVAFALPSKVARPIIAELRENGEVVRGWLGVSVQPLTSDLAKGLNLPNEKGALIGSVSSGSPAAKAGLKSGDVVLSLNGSPVKDAGQLAWMVSQRDPGESVELKIWRNGETRTVEVELGRMSEGRMAQADQPSKQVARALGLKVAPAEPQVLEEFGLPSDVNGAVVVAVARGGPAASRGIRPGDVIARVGQTPVGGAGEFRRIVRKAVNQDADGLVLLVRRGNQAQFVAVPLAKSGEGTG